MMSVLVLFLLHALSLYFTGTWRKWKEYYSTVQYVIIGDFSYNILFSDRLLWRYEVLFDHRIADLYYAFIIFPCVVMLFLRYYPKGLLKELLYIMSWTTFYSIIESISVKNGSMTHFDGWNIYWSGGIYFFGFILIRLHYKYPLVVWPVSLGFAIATMIIFQQPFHFMAYR